jgi:membrane protein DedA with SNARE-associated domain
MVYGGALAAGAFAGQSVVLFGRTIEDGPAAYVAIVLAGTIGYTIGSIIGWAIGLYGGRPYLERHGRWLHLDKEKLDRAERWFERWEDWAVFIGRVTPVVRSFVSIPAGVMEVPFVLHALTLAGSAIWSRLQVRRLGKAEDFHHAFRYLTMLPLRRSGGCLAVVRWLRRRRAAKSPSE